MERGRICHKSSPRGFLQKTREQMFQAAQKSNPFIEENTEKNGQRSGALSHCPRALVLRSEFLYGGVSGGALGREQVLEGGPSRMGLAPLGEASESSPPLPPRRTQGRGNRLPSGRRLSADPVSTLIPHFWSPEL